MKLLQPVKKLLVPYYKQKTDYRCGPASLRMLLGSHGYAFSENELARLALTSTEGTSRGEMVTATRIALDGKGFFIEHHPHGTIDDLVAIINQDYPIIVDWRCPEGVGHFSVLYGYGGGNLYLHDPLTPRRKRMSPKEFLTAWAYDNPPNWYLYVEAPKISHVPIP